MTSVQVSGSAKVNGVAQTASTTISVGAVQPPPAGKALIGSSGGKWGTAGMIAILKPKVVRAFNPADAAVVPVGTPIVYSNDQNRPAEYALLNGSSAAALEAEWRSVFKDDSCTHFLILLHEEDTAANGNDFVRWAKVYAAARIILDKINVGRKHKILLTSCTTGMPFDSLAYKNWDCAAVDVLGFDNYARKHWDTMIAWAKSLNKPWGVPETGIKAQLDPTMFSDAEIAAAMVADHPYWLQSIFTCYWPNGGNELVDKPAAQAQLKAYIAA